MSDHFNTKLHIKSDQKESLITVFTRSFYPIICCATIIWNQSVDLYCQLIDCSLHNDNTKF